MYPGDKRYVESPRSPWTLTLIKPSFAKDTSVSISPWERIICVFEELHFVTCSY